MKTASTKTKLTLTVRKSAVTNARKYSRRTGKSISALFEEMFLGNDPAPILTEQQKAAGRLLKILESAKSVKSLDDKKLLAAHVAKKFA